MDKLHALLDSSSAHHKHLCPRQVLGVRMGLLAGEVLDIEVPQARKRLFTFVESDGCGMGGISTATGCFVRRRTMQVLDFGKLAATFVDRKSGAAVRIYPHPESRLRAVAALPNEKNRWTSQLKAYQFLPDSELFVVEQVELTVSLKAIISKPGVYVNCNTCGEEIGNEREVVINGRNLCRSCAGENYYRPTPAPLFALAGDQAAAANGFANNHMHYQTLPKELLNLN